MLFERDGDGCLRFSWISPLLDAGAAPRFWNGLALSHELTRALFEKFSLERGEERYRKLTLLEIDHEAGKRRFSLDLVDPRHTQDHEERLDLSCTDIGVETIREAQRFTAIQLQHLREFIALHMLALELARDQQPRPVFGL